MGFRRDLLVDERTTLNVPPEGDVHDVWPDRVEGNCYELGALVSYGAQRPSFQDTRTQPARMIVEMTRSFGSCRVVPEGTRGIG